MKMSCLQNKSEIMFSAAKESHENNLYAAVAHGAYYSCYQLMKHIWIYVMNKTENELNANCSQTSLGSHEYLANAIFSYVHGIITNDEERTLRSQLIQLKKLRVDADYSDKDFSYTNSNACLTYANTILPILKKIK